MTQPKNMRRSTKEMMKKSTLMMTTNMMITIIMATMVTMAATMVTMAAIMDGVGAGGQVALMAGGEDTAGEAMVHMDTGVTRAIAKSILKMSDKFQLQRNRLLLVVYCSIGTGVLL